MAQPARVLFLLVDGIGDVSVPEFGDRTPLEVAHVPHMDAIAAGGLTGLLDPVEPGLACGSDTAHMSLFGYDPRIHYRGRGAFESMGAGIPMAPGDIAFKCNFATLDPASGIVTSRRADRHFEHVGPTLCRALDGLRLPGYPDHSVAVQYATEHRCGVAVRGPGLSDSVGDTDPLKDRLPLRRSVATDDTPEAHFTAGLVNALSDAFRAVLESHPINSQRAAAGQGVANVVLLRGCGSRIRVPSFQQNHGMRPCLVAPTKIIAGLGLSFDIDSLDAPGATGSYDSQFHVKAETICDALTGGHRPNTTTTTTTTGTGTSGAAGQPQQEQQQQEQQRGGGGDDDAAAREGSGADGGAQDKQQQHGGGGSGGGGSGRGGGYEFGFVHVKAVDDTGHDRMVQNKVRFLEVVDRLVGQMLRRLWAAEAAGCGRYLLVLAGDHSTPVMFGDHSNEPVPFAIAGVRHAVEALGGPAYIESVPLGPIPLPDIKNPPPSAELCKQAAFKDARRKAAWAGRPWDPAMPAELFGPWREPWPQAVRGDPVRAYDEVSVARGALGRFPGSQVMRLVKQFAGVADAEAPGR
ncbi:hypothetical protein PLESTB_001480100 [Pleodorina starrii]|uniref:Metalloenzyme domain-containing protein n=1 Tax=Pleodorina starrii TaxID=330485 RepID=A0A9W6BX46_9CHLO|nr:hypothetical protein PLESTM_000651600 [Pleodorina starrii]GLC59380.1 hypothetical protein PLESTB_001480100 [Pleodorina starrii]GLC74421.1 hypothetical protein PLESTF_001511200 [Pleodorina starrii]